MPPTQRPRDESRLQPKEALLEYRLSPLPRDQNDSGWNTHPALRSWEDNENSAQEIPPEQRGAFSRTRDVIIAMVKEIFGATAPLAEDALDLLDFTPVPGLRTVAKTLINIWRAVQQVETNRLAFLRLTYSCAAILLSLHSSIAHAGEAASDELAHPIKNLELAYWDIENLVEWQLGRPRFKCCLVRDECLRSISNCNDALLRALKLFEISVEIRVLDIITKNPLYKKSEDYLSTLIEQTLDRWEKRQAPIPGPSSEPSNMPASESSDIGEVLLALHQQLRSAQAKEDAKLDLEDLRRFMTHVLHRGSDVDLINFLQIVRQDMPEAIKALQTTLESSNDTFDQKFIKSGISSLQRISADVGANLPNPKFAKLDKQIGVGNFSQVYKGIWKGRAVAIKVLAKEIPSDLFIREMNVWEPLDHPNVLRLLGASRVTDKPPWFFVSPLMKHGCLVQFLKRIATKPNYDFQPFGTIENLPISRSCSKMGHPSHRVLRDEDAYRILQDIAQGMEYLHGQSILHGDLKATNVLLDDGGRCVISDFGQSGVRPKIYRITREDQRLQGTFRWEAPELMNEQGVPSRATDAYAYGILCTEVLTMGEIPWPECDDATVRLLVLIRDKRLAIPADYRSPQLRKLVNMCWARDPEKRPQFSVVARTLQELVPTTIDRDPMPPRSSWTPSTRFDSFEYISVPAAEIINATEILTEMEEGGNGQASGDNLTLSMGLGEAGVPTTTMEMDCEDETQYRQLLEHEYDPSLSLPLWTPTMVELGDVGYISKSRGVFVTLFNASRPSHEAGGPPQGMPSIAGYDTISCKSTRKGKRNVALKSLDAVAGLLGSKSLKAHRRQSFTLCAGHKCAHIYTESTEHQYIKKLDAPKAWFDANVDTIMTIYRRQHAIPKEDICLVIGALQARRHALFVSHEHLDGQVHFNAFSVQKKGQPWGKFTTDTTVPANRGGPRYEESSRELFMLPSVKISVIGDPQKTVLIACLRFRTDETGCTQH